MPSAQEALPVESLPKTIPFDDYHAAGGGLDEGAYSRFKDALEGNREFQPIHIKQAEVLARQANLLDPDKVKVTASAYAVLREVANRVPSLEEKPLDSDQSLFAEAVLATQGKEVYDTFRK